MATDFWTLLERRAARLAPDVRAAFEAAVRRLRATVTERELTELIEAGRIEDIVARVVDPAVFDDAVAPFTRALNGAIQQAATTFLVDVPGARADGRTVRVRWDGLNPRVLDGVRSYRADYLDRLRTEVADTIRDLTANGLRAGVHPVETARSLRATLGLAPNQAGYVANLRGELRSGDPERLRAALRRVLRDRRYDGIIERAIAGERGLTERQIADIVGAYERRWIKHAADMVARDAANDALRQGQHLTWRNAVDQGFVYAADLSRTWYTRIDGRERDEHRAMHQQRTTFEAPFVGPAGTAAAGRVWQRVGQGDFACRCHEFTRPRIVSNSELRASGRRSAFPEPTGPVNSHPTRLIPAL